MRTGPHQLLFYDYVADILERRAPHRPAHLDQARAWMEDGRLLAAGAIGDPPTGAAFVFIADADVLAFVTTDPYVAHDLVTAWRIEPWTVAVAAGEPA